MALNPLLKRVVESQFATPPKETMQEHWYKLFCEQDVHRQEVLRLKAELQLAKAEVKALRLDLRVRRAEAGLRDIEQRLILADQLASDEVQAMAERQAA